MKAEQMEVQGVCSSVGMALIKLKEDMRLILGNEAYEALMESESNNVSTLLNKE